MNFLLIIAPKALIFFKTLRRKKGQIGRNLSHVRRKHIYMSVLSYNRRLQVSYLFFMYRESTTLMIKIKNNLQNNEIPQFESF